MPSFDFDPAGMGPPLARPGYLVAVQRYDPAEINQPLQFLPNVQCLQVEEREGLPAIARFRYILDASGNTPGPDGFEDLIPVTATGPNVVQQGDRLTVTVASSSSGGAFRCIFDGFAEAPQVGFGPREQHATFQAQGVAVRLWDTPISGALIRDADDPTLGADIQTDLPVRFNPDDRAQEPTPNATPAGADAGGGTGGNDPGSEYPVFLDPRPPEETAEDEAEDDGTAPEPDDDSGSTGDTRRPWTLDMAVKYLLWQGNPDQDYVVHYPTTPLASALEAIAPKAPGQPIDPANPATFTASPIIVRDYDASNKPCMDSVRDLLWAHGFRYRFRLTPYSDGSPRTTLVFYRRDGLFGVAPKPLMLQAEGATLNPGLSNASTFTLAREAVRYNQVAIETDPVQYEIAVILAPGFVIAGGDAASTAGMEKYTRSSWLADAANAQQYRDYYRLFVYDECGDGHWDWPTNAMVSTPEGADSSVKLSNVFGAGQSNPSTLSVRRYRPGKSDLVMKRAGVPLKAQLDVAVNYDSSTPSVCDGSGGPWQPVASGEWQLLRNRLGIRFTSNKPNDISLGSPPVGVNDVMGANGRLRLIELLSNAVKAGSTTPPFFLRLTVVVESDRGLGVVSQRRIASPSPFTTVARIDCRDHYRKAVIDPSSPYFKASDIKPDPTTGQVFARDDTAKAQSYADAIRSAGELGEWRGTATIPRITLAYEVGDRISGIVGRTASFQQNAGSGAGEGPNYPMVTGITWNFDGQQSTTLSFGSDNDKPMEM